MNTRRTMLGLLVSLATAGAFAATNGPAPDPARFAAEVAKFAAADATNPPPAHPILFAGSSSIRLWKTLATDFPGRPVLNRGFGGAQIPDVLHYFDRVVKPYAPRAIVFYCGDNDIASGRSPDQVRDDFAAFVERCRACVPGVPIAFISMKPSPKRWALWATVSEGNRLVADVCGKGKGLTFIDVGRPMLGADGQPRAELFVADKLHMNATGYAIWTGLVREFVAGLPAAPAAAP